ncbi:hypothetical protein QBC35DRAFT_388165 [Podospora australis]|uniref:Uncharacterized protein n=1 Tax=Podospora australis TaxID=1536484 RepID=A0AAN6WQ88_9PEZI|nr:hypothetical protein QBC35DRAFT_388165 [Podospora australis]
MTPTKAAPTASTPAPTSVTTSGSTPTAEAPTTSSPATPSAASTADETGIITTTPITDEVLRAVYASDQEMYPVGLTYSRLRQWVAACPDLSICFQSTKIKQGLLGVVIVLPLLRSYWEDLLTGKLKEPDIDPEKMFPRPASSSTPVRTPGMAARGGGKTLHVMPQKQEVGLHVYHIERLAVEPPTPKQKRFSDIAMEEVTRRSEERGDWVVVGHSALTATDGGKRTFQRLGFKSTGYRELFVTTARRNSQATLSSSDGLAGETQERERPEAEEEEELEMMFIYPDEDGASRRSVSEIIGYGRKVVSMSEMTVKHLVSDAIPVA